MNPLTGWLTDDDGDADRGFEVVVLGCSGTRPGPGRACSSYLFRTPEANVLVDCGYGSTCNLQRIMAPEDLDAVVISHEHPDHCVDLIGMYYALRFHEDGPLSLDVHAPPGVGEFLSQMLSGDSQSVFSDVCHFHDVEAGDRLTFGDLEMHFYASLHPVPTISVRATHDGKVVTYSADSAGGSWLEEAARDADLFICEASWVGDPSGYPEGVHLTAGQAGDLARKAGAERLVLTHIWPQNDRERSRREASETYGAPVDLADDGQLWQVGL